MPEMNMGQLAPQVKAALGDIPFVSMTQANGRLIKPETIERAVEENLAKLGVEI
jgi:hypothetical protein